MTTKKIFNASNLLSFIRLLLVIPAWITFYSFDKVTAGQMIAGIGIFAAITDILDGYLARKLNQITEFGKIIDPLADKVLIAFVVINLYLLNQLPDYYFYLIIGRDLLILAGGIIVTKITGKVLPSDYLGKATVLTVSFVLLMILLDVTQSSLLFDILYYASIILIFASFTNYLIKSYKTIILNKSK